MHFNILNAICKLLPLLLLDAVLDRSIVKLLLPSHYLAYHSRLPFYHYEHLLICVLYVSGLVILWCMVCLTTKVLLYIHAATLLVLVAVASHWINTSIISDLQNAPEAYNALRHFQNNLPNLVMQAMLAGVYVIVRRAKSPAISLFDILSLFLRSKRSFLVYFFFMYPVMACCFMHWAPVWNIILHLSLIVTLSDIFYGCSKDFWAIIPQIKMAYVSRHASYMVYGLENLISTEWNRIQLGKTMILFWIVRMSFKTIYWMCYANDSLPTYNVTSNITHPSIHPTNSSHGDMSSGTSVHTLSMPEVLLISTCETFLSIMATSSVISYLGHYLGILLSKFMNNADNAPMNLGTMCCSVFLILALQTGLTGLEASKRLVRLHHNFCLLFTAILHFSHSNIEPLLMALGAQPNRKLADHIRLLVLCALLIILPAILIPYLWSTHSLSTWLLAVTAFGIEVIIKVIVSLLQYLLFIIDSWRSTFWDGLDDYLYYIKATGSTIEFIFGILLFCNGTWVMLFESGSTIRAVMMGIHAYFNIWEEARKGWKVFVKRQSVVRKINAIPTATKDELESFNDVCAICYQNLNVGHILACKHIFHGICLRKWFYINDNCPMCHRPIAEPATEQNSELN